jgi:mRNA-degrading endonuclease HigB of HigAB toxin-antitoxin module
MYQKISTEWNEPNDVKGYYANVVVLYAEEAKIVRAQGNEI